MIAHRLVESEAASPVEAAKVIEAAPGNGYAFSAISTFIVTFTGLDPTTLLQTLYPLVSATLGMQLGGAFGNLLDRITQGYVVDFVDVGVGDIRFWAFNVADSSIVVGIILVTAALWYEEHRATTPKPA